MSQEPNLPGAEITGWPTLWWYDADKAAKVKRS